MSKSSYKGALILTFTALLWGMAFVAQSDAADKMSTESFIFYRFLLGALVLLPVIAVLDRYTPAPSGTPEGFLSRFAHRDLLVNGALCGALLFFASLLQQASLALGTTSGKCGFITAMYMVFVPLTGLFLGKKIRPIVWIGVLLSASGMYFLCLWGESSFALGDLLVLGSAFLYTAHILVVDRAVTRVDCVRLSCLQFLTAGLLGGIVTCFTGFPSLSVVGDAAVSILYVGIFSSGVAYTLQIIGQKTCDAAIAPLIMSLESVFAALSGWIILGETMSLPQFAGCALIFTAVILIQLPPLTTLQRSVKNSKSHS